MIQLEAQFLPERLIEVRFGEKQLIVVVILDGVVLQQLPQWGGVPGVQPRIEKSFSFDYFRVFLGELAVRPAGAFCPEQDFSARLFEFFGDRVQVAVEDDVVTVGEKYYLVFVVLVGLERFFQEVDLPPTSG